MKKTYPRHLFYLPGNFFYSDTDAAAGAPAGAAAPASAAASAVCIYYVVIGGRFAPPYKYMIKYIQQKQQRQQHQNLFWQFIQSMKSYLMNCQPYQVLPNELPNLAIYSIGISF